MPASQYSQVAERPSVRAPTPAGHVPSTKSHSLPTRESRDGRNGGTRTCVRTAAARRLFPSGRALFDTADIKEAKALLEELG